MRIFPHIFRRLSHLLFWLIGAGVLSHTVFAGLEDDIKESVEDIVPDVQTARNVDEAAIFHETQTLIFQILGIVTVIMILYVALKIMLAKGNAEEFKTESKALVYIIVGLAIVPLSFFMIKYLVGLRL